MSLRCKKGDLAICLKTEKGENVGSIVEVVDFIGDRSERDGDKNLWKIRSERIPHPLEIIGGFWTMPDAWLLPVRPGDLKEADETEKEVESV